MSYKPSYAIAITGGIATGKSTFCSLLRLFGYEIIDADKIAHIKLQESANKIAELFGSDYVNNGIVDKKRLGSLVFSNKEAKKSLEELLHPKIRKEIFNYCCELDKKYIPYFVDIPLFFETKAYEIKPVVLVYAPKELQIKRIVKRDNLSYEDALKRIENQIDIEQKKELADYVVDNSSNLANLEKEAQKLIDWIKSIKVS